MPADPAAMTPKRWTGTLGYLDALFPPRSVRGTLAGLGERAGAAGLPPISLSPHAARLAQVLCLAIGARTAVEIGTLGGYSAIAMASALGPEGRLYTLEINDRHADFAASELAAAGLADRVTIVRGPALRTLPELSGRLGPGAVDLILLDGHRPDYPAYLPHCRLLLRPGGLLLMDNALGGGSYWIDDAPGNPERDAVAAINEQLAHDSHFDTAIAPTDHGLLIARKR